MIKIEGKKWLSSQNDFTLFYTNYYFFFITEVNINHLFWGSSLCPSLDLLNLAAPNLI